MSDRSLALVRALAASFAVLFFSTAGAGEIDETVLLVAKRQVKDPLYSSTIMLVKPTIDGGHIGVIVNRPTTVKLAEVFPEHEPSKKIGDPLFIGGPADVNVVFAVVVNHDGASDDSVPLTAELSLAYSGGTVDHIIESEPDRARFFLGVVVWRPGQLRAELKRGLWYVQEPEAKLVLRKQTDGMWDELVRQSEEKSDMI